MNADFHRFLKGNLRLSAFIRVLPSQDDFQYPVPTGQVGENGDAGGREHCARQRQDFFPLPRADLYQQSPS